jgi:hypothetical protein
MYPTVSGNTLDSVAVEQLFNLANGLSNIIVTYGDESKALPVACACASGIIKGVGLESGEIVSMEGIVDWLKKTYNAIKNKISDAMDAVSAKLSKLSSDVKMHSKEFDLAVKQFDRVKDKKDGPKTVTVGPTIWTLLIGEKLPSDLAREFKRLYDEAPDTGAASKLIETLVDGSTAKKLHDGYRKGGLGDAVGELQELSDSTQEAVEKTTLKNTKPVKQSDTNFKGKIEGKLVATDYYLGNWRAIFELPADKKDIGSTQWGTQNMPGTAGKDRSELETPTLTAGEVANAVGALKPIFTQLADSEKTIRALTKGYNTLVSAANEIGSFASWRGESKEWFDAYNNLIRYQLDVLNMIGSLYAVYGNRTLNSVATYTRYVKASTKALEG